MRTYVRQIIVFWNDDDDSVDSDSVPDPTIEIGAEKNRSKFRCYAAPFLKRHSSLGRTFNSVSSLLIYEDYSENTLDLVIKLGPQLEKLLLRSVRLKERDAMAIAFALNPNLLHSLDIAFRKFASWPRLIGTCLAARGEWPALRHLEADEFEMQMLDAPNLESLTLVHVNWKSPELPRLAEKFPRLRHLNTVYERSATTQFLANTPLLHSHIDEYTKKLTGFPAHVLRFGGELFWSIAFSKLGTAPQGLIDSSSDVSGSDLSFWALGRALLYRGEAERLEKFHEKQLEILLSKFVDSNQDLLCPQAYLVIFILSSALLCAGKTVRGKFWQEKFIKLLPRSSTADQSLAQFITSNVGTPDDPHGVGMWEVWVRALGNRPIPLEASVVPKLEEILRSRIPRQTEARISLLCRMIDSSHFPDPVRAAAGLPGRFRQHPVIVALAGCKGTTSNATGSYGELIKLAKFAHRHGLSGADEMTKFSIAQFFEEDHSVFSDEEQEFCRLFVSLFSRSINCGIEESQMQRICTGRGYLKRLFDILHVWQSRWPPAAVDREELLDLVDSLKMNMSHLFEVEGSSSVIVLAAEFMLNISEDKLLEFLSPELENDQESRRRWKSLLKMLDEVVPTLDWSEERKVTFVSKSRPLLELALDHL